MQDVLRVREQVRPVEGAPREQLLHELRQLPARVLPREVRVRLSEADLRKGRHHRGRGERLGEEDDVGLLAPHLGDQPLPEGNRLRVRVVHAEDAHPPAHPDEHDVEQRLPETTPVVRSEVDVVDVLVLLRWVLRVLQRAVGATVEPLGVLAQPRMVGRRLDREVDADLAADLAAAGDHRLEVLDGAELGVDRVVPALLRADRPRAADVAAPGDERVVAALAVRDADRVDRRQVDDVEPELRQLRQRLPDAAEAAPRAREELVPGTERSALAVDVHGERRGDGSLAPLARRRCERAPRR